MKTHRAVNVDVTPTGIGARWPVPSWETVRQAPAAGDYVTGYRAALRVRASVTQCVLEMRKGAVRFWIGGPGEEVHGAATALAIHRYDQEGEDRDSEVTGRPAVSHTSRTALFPHYRSDTLALLLAELRGHPDPTLAYFRQAFCRATDDMTAGRQMVMHLSLPGLGIMPVQSPLGMNLGKAAGYARGNRALGLNRATVTICGDGTTSTSDFHEAFVASSIWRLPLVVIVTDNEIAISVKPSEGRGIRDFESYANAFGAGFIELDGSDFDQVYGGTLSALRYAEASQAPVLVHVHVPRLRGHSSSDGAAFEYGRPDPLILYGEWLSDSGLIPPTGVFRRREDATGRDYLADHILGSFMEQEVAAVREVLERVRKEPAPAPGDEFRHQRPPEPVAVEPAHTGTSTIQVNEALNLALHRIVDEGNTLLWGQDIAGDKGGVFKVTRGLAGRHPTLVSNAPINEPLIVGTAAGASHHAAMRTIPEIQFGDYSLNTLHWLVHIGNTYWGSGGQLPLNITLRTPVDPVQGGALYHSMSVDGYFTPVQGWVICCPSTPFDAYGLLRQAADYPGPVLMLEPKALYRRSGGPRLPGEPSPEECKSWRRRSGESLLDIDDMALIADFRIPFGKAAVRRRGHDLTIVSYGLAALDSVDVADALAAEGYSVTVIDLRTLSPWDVDAVVGSVRETGRLLVAHADRTFASFGREVQGTVHEHLEGVLSQVVGMRNVPAVGQAKELEEHTVLGPERIAQAAREMLRRRPGAFVENDHAWLAWAPSNRYR